MGRKPKTTSPEDLRIAGFDPTKNTDATFDSDAADRVCGFFADHLKHVRGVLGGKPFKLETWQRTALRNLFGWKKADGTRRFREAFIFVPRKNGKTTILAGIVLYGLFCDREEGAEVYSAAGDREQASLIYEQAKGMLLRSPELSSRGKVYTTTKAITCEKTNSAYKAISAEAATKHGYNAHMVVVDELHTQPNRELVDVLQTSMGSRTQPLMLYITTAGFDRQSICYEKYDYACKVRDGVIHDDSFLPIIYEASPDDDWTSEITWKKANPNYGVSVSPEYLSRECEKAKSQASYENTFRRLFLNLWTEQDERWISIDKWDACKHETPEHDLRSLPCYAGLDLSSKIDVTAFALAWGLGGGKFAVRQWFWIPEESMHERERRDRVPYSSWVRSGHMHATPGSVIDYEYIRAEILRLRGEYDIQEIAFDPWNATQLATQLVSDGLNCAEMRQGYASLGEPSKEFEKLIIGKELQHDGNPIMRWMVSNVAKDEDPAGNIKPSKNKSREKIDGVVATIMAIGRASVNEQSGPLMVF